MKYIIIEGNIGAGKTTLVKKFGEEFSSDLILERFDKNPFLGNFYQNPERYSFHTELFFLSDRFQHLESFHESKKDNPERIILSDYDFSKCMIFGSITLQGEELKIFRNLFEILHARVPRPDLYVYLHVDVEILLDNIHMRGRNYEGTIDKSYLMRVEESYKAFLASVTDIPVLWVSTGEANSINHNDTYTKLRNIIFNHQYPKGITRTKL